MHEPEEGAGAPAGRAAGWVGVLAMVYGAPASPHDVEAYYTHVRGGRPPTPALLADLRRRYEAIGGTSPLAARTAAQVRGLQAALGDGFFVALGNKHAPPFLEEALAGLLAAGADTVVGLVLAPHVSALSTGEYHRRAAAAAGTAARYTTVARWHDHPVLVRLLAARVADALGRFPPEAVVETLVSAHSLPERARTLDHPTYPDQLRDTAAAVAAAAGVERWRVAWQSAGRTPEPWIGPDILEVVRGLAGEGVDGVLVCPAGFVSDHLEVLYDVDVEARAVAEEAGLRLERTASLDDDPAFVALLADLVRQAAAAP